MDFWSEFPARGTLETVDKVACRFRDEKDIGLAAFASLFTRDYSKAMLVQLGDYSRRFYNGNPWTLPGGAVDPGESPSSAARREIKEEASLEIDVSEVIPAAWFARPYYKSRHANNIGEIIVLFAAVMDELKASPSPPETLGARFFTFDFNEWINVPSEGSGTHVLQPLPKHWVYWSQQARQVLIQNRGLSYARYDSAEKMSQEPIWVFPD